MSDGEQLPDGASGMEAQDAGTAYQRPPEWEARMNVAIIDVDLIGRKKHRFPNLACEKISGYYKGLGHSVELKTDYDNLADYDEVYISKVFTDTPFPGLIKESERIHLGGTGFFFDKAPALPDEMEHSFPDYHLYDDWIAEQIRQGIPKQQFKEYTDYSIGFMTRGCFRKCGFCVNQKYDHVFRHSPLDEFLDPSRKKICLLDDNFLGCPQWKVMLQELIDTGKPFKFKQGLDERLLTDEKCEMLFNARYDSDMTFAFDKIEDYELIESKLQMIRRHTDRRCRFYVLCGYVSTDIDDIVDIFRRIELLIKYGCYPYIMRYQSETAAPWKESKYHGMYSNMAAWCNQPAMFKSSSFRKFCKRRNTERYMLEFEAEHPDIAARYFDMKWGGVTDDG